MSLCIGICQMDEFGYCTGCGRTQAEIDGVDPAAPSEQTGTAKDDETAKISDKH